jgi:hypothetical protein
LDHRDEAEEVELVVAAERGVEVAGGQSRHTTRRRRDMSEAERFSVGLANVAWKLFDEMPHGALVVLNMMVRCYFRCFQSTAALFFGFSLRVVSALMYMCPVSKSTNSVGMLHIVSNSFFDIDNYSKCHMLS